MKTINVGLNEYLRSSSKLKFSFRRRSISRRLFVLFNALVIVAALLFAYYLRYSFSLDSSILVVALKQSLLALIVYLAFEVLFRSFAGLTNYKTNQDIRRVFISTTCSVALLMLIKFLGSHLARPFDLINIPGSILLIHYISVLILWTIFRILFKAKAWTKKGPLKLDLEDSNFLGPRSDFYFRKGSCWQGGFRPFKSNRAITIEYLD